MIPLPGTGDATVVRDRFNRPLQSLRISVTDRCNLRCQYCMPEEEYSWLPRQTLLTFEEIATLTDLFADVAIEDEVRNFYSNFFKVELSRDDAETILMGRAGEPK